MTTKKNYTIKKYAGEKTMILNSWSDITADLYKMACKMKVAFAIKEEIGISVIGTFTVADHLGISDVSKLINFVNAD